MNCQYYYRWSSSYVRCSVAWHWINCWPSRIFPRSRFIVIWLRRNGRIIPCVLLVSTTYLFWDCRLSRYQQFKDFQKRILVATNLFGRGMDIERVNIVFNYDMPEDSDTYLHRVRKPKIILQASCSFFEILTASWFHAFADWWKCNRNNWAGGAFPPYGSNLISDFNMLYHNRLSKRELPLKQQS